MQFIHVTEVQGHNQSIIAIDSGDMREALHIAADRIINEYADGGQRSYNKREVNWVGYPHPSIVIEATPNGVVEWLTACQLWQSVSDDIGLTMERPQDQVS
jgi:hypothetical protein